MYYATKYKTNYVCLSFRFSLEVTRKRLGQKRGYSMFYGIASEIGKYEWEMAYFFRLPIISSGFTHSSNCSFVSKPRSRAASRKVEPSLCAFLAIFAALS